MLGSDANINCAAQAAKCLTGFAKGLRTKFAHNALTVAPVVFEKFREKKATLKDPLVELIDAVFASSVSKSKNMKILFQF
jgi:cytoskeleton-associated protein 5